MSEPKGIDVLHVDDDQDLADIAATFLEREDDRFDVETAPDASSGLERLSEDRFDCVVSDYDMPGQNGIELLEAVRADYPDLPFILYTGKGSEEVAAEAISAGVTDYLQKQSGTDQYTVLANRIRNAVERREAERERKRHLKAIETAREGISILDEDGHYIYVNQAFAGLHGYDPEEMTGEHWQLAYRDQDIHEVREDILPEVEQVGHWHGETTSLRADGSTVTVDHTLSLTDQGELICTVRDISDRKRREQELRQTTARLEALFEHSPDMINVHDTDGNILDPNPRLCERTGYDRSEVTGMNVWDLDRDIDPDEAYALWEDMEVGDSRRLEGTYQRNDGSTFPVEIHVRRLRFEGEDRFVAIARDISERKERQTELERYERVVQNLPVGVFRTTPDGDIISTNDQFVSLFEGESKDDFADVGAKDLYADSADREAILDGLEREGLVEDQRHEVVTLDGETKWIETTLRITDENGDRYIDGIVEDVTERRERRRQLEQAETMFENAQDALFLIDVGEEFTIERVNPAYEEATGLSNDALSGRTPRDVLGDEQGGEVERKYRECVTQQRPLEYEETLTIGGGQTHWETRIAPAVIDGEVEKIVGATRDTTERKERRRELERYETILEALGDPVYALDPDGCYTFVNDAFAEQTGYPREDLIGAHASETLPDEAVEHGRKVIRDLLSADDRRSEAYELSQITADGERVPCRCHMALLPLDDGEFRGVAGTVRDITERRERRRALERQSDIFAKVQEIAEIGAWSYDVRTGEQFLTDTAYEIHGLSPDAEMSPERSISFYHPDDRPEIREAFERAARDGEPYDLELRLVDADGTQRWVRTSGEPEFEDGAVVRVHGVLQDVTERRERERKIELVETLFEHARECQFITEVAGGAFELRHANSYYKRTVGLPPDEPAAGQTPTELFGETGGQEILDRYRDCVETRESVTYTVEVPVPEEGTVYETILTPVVTDDAVTHVVGTARDITDRTRRERELQRYETLIETLPIGYVRTSFDDEFLAMNSTFVDMLDGDSEEEIRSHDVSEFYRDATTRERLLTTLRDEGEVNAEEVKVTTTGGEVCWVTVTGRLIGADDGLYVDALVQDITERKEYEQRLREERAFIERCLNVLEDVFYVFSSDGEILRWNDRLPEVTGYSDEEIERMEPTDFFPDDHESRITEAVTEVMETGSTTVQADYLTSDGERIPHEFTGFRLTDADGQVLGFAGIGRDLTQQREYERRLEQRNERLEEFAGVVSHDLRNPLRVAEGKLELARGECESEYLEDIGRALDRMDALIEDLLTLAREGEAVTDFDPVDIAAVAEGCWANVETPGATLVTDIDRTVSADESRLRQVFENLVRNAVEHGGDDVTVTVGELDGGFYVEDDGPGIPSEERGEVFEAGYSTSNEGTGFGLSIVEQVVDAHGWDIRVTGGSGGGARFEITGVEFTAT